MLEYKMFQKVSEKVLKYAWQNLDKMCTLWEDMIYCY